MRKQSHAARQASLNPECVQCDAQLVCQPMHRIHTMFGNTDVQADLMQSATSLFLLEARASLTQRQYYMNILSRAGRYSLQRATRA